MRTHSALQLMASLQAAQTLEALQGVQRLHARPPRAPELAEVGHVVAHDQRQVSRHADGHLHAI